MKGCLIIAALYLKGKTKKKFSSQWVLSINFYIKFLLIEIFKDQDSSKITGG